MKREKTPLLRNGAVQSLLASLLCILIGLLVGIFMIVVARPAAKNSDYRHLESAYLHLCGLHNILKKESK